MPGAEIASAGFYPAECRTAPAHVQSAARSIGVDLAGWSSRRVTLEMVSSADLVVLSDLNNFRDFRHNFPESQHKVLFLGLFLDPPQMAITDPYNRSAEETLRIVKLIEAAVTALARQLGG
jgi:protein-tyrosine-phosphatase